MFETWVIPVIAFAYLLVLFGVAAYGDSRFFGSKSQSRPTVYALGLGIYCTTWTFFGSVGLAATSGLNFLAIYLGPLLVVTLGFSLYRRIIEISKKQNITSVADFIGARYGKQLSVAAVAAVIAVIGTVPYIALQLKAISDALTTLIAAGQPGDVGAMSGFAFSNITLIIMITLCVFTILFGTRHADATEHQDGMMLAVAVESVVKITAFVATGVFIVYGIFGSFEALLKEASARPEISTAVSQQLDPGYFITLTALSFMAFIMLPRQFHVGVVENHSLAELKRARWLFPIYLVLINLFVVPIALAGLVSLPQGANADNFVLLLPLAEDASFMALLAFIGGLSAGAAMVVVACVALSIMISNDLILPVYLKSNRIGGHAGTRSLDKQILNIRRSAIILILVMAFGYYTLSNSQANLASIGLVSFVAIAQLGPSFFGAMIWRRATADGARAGMIAGSLVWAYTLLLPTLLSPDHVLVTQGPFGVETLRPQMLFGIDTDPITHGVAWSMFFNISAFILFSLMREPNAQERIQAAAFINSSRGSIVAKRSKLANVTVDELTTMIGHYLGQKRTKRAFEGYWEDRGMQIAGTEQIDHDLLGFSEQLLASAIGTASSRLVHSLLLQQSETHSSHELKLLSEASEAVRHNRDVLQSIFEQLEQGICVFDQDLRLASWNKRFRILFGLPASIGRAGTSLSDIANEIVKANGLSQADPGGELLAQKIMSGDEQWNMVLHDSDRILEARHSPMPAGGFMMTWTDISERVHSAEKLQEANETLERRVEERTSDLVRLNQRLKSATADADSANRSKTRFLAAAGHDILQPLNAARLYSSTLSEKLNGDGEHELVEKVEKSLASVEEILGAVLDISRLDSARLVAKLRDMDLGNVLEQLDLEFQPIAHEKGLKLSIDSTSHFVNSDPQLLRRLLQNLISNAIKYTQAGTVEVVTAVEDDNVVISVIDTGIGIDIDEQDTVFAEFSRLEGGAKVAPGLGLGLSIVRRISKLLEAQTELSSTPGQGTRFDVRVKKADLVEEADNDNLPLSPTPAKAPAAMEGMRVLCIDNDAAILDGMEQLLTTWGCQVSTALSLEDAISSVGSSPLPDVILADYHLDAGRTGIDAVRALRETWNVDVPSVLVTADRSDEVKALAQDNGLSILNKPVKPARLRAIITQFKRQGEAAE